MTLLKVGAAGLGFHFLIEPGCLFRICAAGQLHSLLARV